MKRLMALLATAVLALNATAAPQAAARTGKTAASYRAATTWPLPEGAASPKPIAAPRDTPFPGTIRLEVDATDTVHRLFSVREIIPVQRPGRLTLLFPQWMPGDHAPTGALDRLAGLVVTANGQRIRWARDAAQVHAFHIEVPAGAPAIELQYQYLDATGPGTGPIRIGPRMLDLQWQSVMLYPAGHYTRRITYQASVKLPPDWRYASALDGATQTGDVVSFAPVALDTLVDSPLMAGRHFRQVVLSDDPVPVRLDLVADNPADLDIPAQAIEGYRQAVTQAYRLFGSHHYDHYDLMIWLSDNFGPTYFEQHRSGENNLPAAYFTHWKKYEAYHGLPLHGYVHSWNGLFRRPADMWTPNFNLPERDSLLWVFEGLTMYWADVLTARAGLTGKAEALGGFETTAATMGARAGAQWRPLQDATHQLIIQNGNGLIHPEGRAQPWEDWQRGTSDAYLQGELIWLDADTLIRQQSGGKKSLDDFARAFFGGRNGSYVTHTYRFEDLVAALDSVLVHDWATFLRQRLDDTGSSATLDGITRGGYRLVYTDEPSPAIQAAEARRGTADLRHSLGLTVGKDGQLTAVRWEGPAWRAGLIAGATIVSVNGAPYSAGGLKLAVTAAQSGGALVLSVKEGDTERPVTLAWRGGLRYPHLERIPETADLLGDILAPRP